MVIAGDIAGAAGAGAHPGRGLDHGADHFRMLAHAEIVVGAPDDDAFRPLRRMPHRMRKAPGNTLQIGEDPVAPLRAQLRQRFGEIAVIVNVRSIIGIDHWRSCPAVGRAEYWSCRSSRSVPGCLSRPYRPPHGGRFDPNQFVETGYDFAKRCGPCAVESSCPQGENNLAIPYKRWAADRGRNIARYSP